MAQYAQQFEGSNNFSFFRKGVWHHSTPVSKNRLKLAGSINCYQSGARLEPKVYILDL